MEMLSNYDGNVKPTIDKIKEVYRLWNFPNEMNDAHHISENILYALYRENTYLARNLALCKKSDNSFTKIYLSGVDESLSVNFKEIVAPFYRHFLYPSWPLYLDIFVMNRDIDNFDSSKFVQLETQEFDTTEISPDHQKNRKYILYGITVSVSGHVFNLFRKTLDDKPTQEWLRYDQGTISNYDLGNLRHSRTKWFLFVDKDFIPVMNGEISFNECLRKTENQVPQHQSEKVLSKDKTSYNDESQKGSDSGGVFHSFSLFLLGMYVIIFLEIV